jgi:hypothetical protein
MNARASPEQLKPHGDRPPKNHALSTTGFAEVSSATVPIIEPGTRAPVRTERQVVDLDDIDE